jgi:DNA-directed RNA polymerase subunit omega
VSGVTGVPEGITNPPIDELLSKVDSKYALVLYAAKRARQINAYYSQLGEGLLEYVGPLVDTHVQEKPLSIAMREINADLLTYERFDGDIDPATGLEVQPAPTFGFDAVVADDQPQPTDG